MGLPFTPSTTLRRRKRSSTDSWARRTKEVELTPADMHDYQWLGAHFLADNRFCALFVDMGLGKTVMTITAIWLMLQRSKSLDLPCKILIVGPRKVVCETWPTEFRKWRQGCLFDYSIVHGTASERAAALMPKRDVYLISRDNIDWLVEHYGKDWPFHWVVIDESSGFGDHASNRFKALKKVRGRIKCLWELTASPATEGYERLFAQTWLLDRGERFGDKVTPFREQYFTENRYTHKRTLRAGAGEQILEKLQDICLTLKAEDHLPRDKPTEDNWYVELSDKNMELYRSMEEDQIVTIGDTDITTDTAAQTWLKLLQLASGFIYEGYVEYDPVKDAAVKLRNVHEVHTQKIEMLKEKLEALDSENVMIVFHFKTSLARLQKALGKKAVLMDDDGKCIKRWNAGKIKWLLIHPQSGGHGLNLQKGGRRIVFYDIPPSLELYEQVIGRIDRQGQERVVFLHHVLARGTLDEYVHRRLKEKADVQADLFARLKRLQAKRKRALMKKARQAAEEAEFEDL